MPVAVRLEPKQRYIFALDTILWLVVVLGFTLPSVLGQAESPLSGTVVTTGGQAVAGATVYGSLSKACCPFKREQTTTDKEGRFRLEHPGAVIHFSAQSFQPQTFVIKPGRLEVRATMPDSIDRLEMPWCKKPEPSFKQIGWGQYGLQFSVPTRATNILGGKPDVDYVRYLVKAKTSKATLELWFGPYAMNMDPDDELIIDSAAFAERNVLNAKREVIGKDSWGHLPDGTAWRQTAVIAEGGARYRNASPENVELFDQVINSICDIPSLSHSFPRSLPRARLARACKPPIDYVAVSLEYIVARVIAFRRWLMRCGAWRVAFDTQLPEEESYVVGVFGVALGFGGADAVAGVVVHAEQDGLAAAG